MRCAVNWKAGLSRSQSCDGTPRPADFTRIYELSIGAGIHFRILGQPVNRTGAQECRFASGILPGMRGAAGPDGRGPGAPPPAADVAAPSATADTSPSPRIQAHRAGPARVLLF